MAFRADRQRGRQRSGKYTVATLKRTELQQLFALQRDNLLADDPQLVYHTFVDTLLTAASRVIPHGRGRPKSRVYWSEACQKQRDFRDQLQERVRNGDEDGIPPLTAARAELQRLVRKGKQDAWESFASTLGSSGSGGINRAYGVLRSMGPRRAQHGQPALLHKARYHLGSLWAAKKDARPRTPPLHEDRRASPVRGPLPPGLLTATQQLRQYPRNLTHPDATVEAQRDGEILRERDLGWDPSDYSTEPEDEDKVENGLPGSIWQRERRRQKCLRIMRARRCEPAAWDRPPKLRERRLKALRREGLYGPARKQSLRGTAPSSTTKSCHCKIPG